ncbi:MAG: helix-turn-helix transcriptional regulator [Bacteroidales bacterium]|nr:helix-turn-helix transcriptional regulator [Bacteroidales bacterium]
MQELSEKEVIIARYAAEGMTAKEIAEAMFLSQETIRWYRKRMLRKADARNFSELIAMLKDENIL